MKIKTKADKINRREKNIRILRLALLISILFLFVIYFVLRIIYTQGNFTISLNEEFAKKSGIIMYENSIEKENRMILKAPRPEFMDNISIDWLPKNINNESDGSHNGENYIAYTFYIENQGSESLNYWYKVPIDDVIKGVDKAIRVMIYINDDVNIFAKKNSNGEAENGTKAFYSDEVICVEEKKDFSPGDKDKITVVVWVEGNDPDCKDELIGGEMKMHLEITEEHM